MPAYMCGSRREGMHTSRLRLLLPIFASSAERPTIGRVQSDDTSLDCRRLRTMTRQRTWSAGPAARCLPPCGPRPRPARSSSARCAALTLAAASSHPAWHPINPLLRLDTAGSSTCEASGNRQNIPMPVCLPSNTGRIHRMLSVLAGKGFIPGVMHGVVCSCQPTRHPQRISRRRPSRPPRRALAQAPLERRRLLPRKQSQSCCGRTCKCSAIMWTGAGSCPNSHHCPSRPDPLLIL